MNTVGQCAIITGIGLAFLVASGRRVWLAVRSRSWQQVQGTVANSYVTTTSANMSAGRSTGHTTYLVVVYRYAAGGKTHESKRWAFDFRPPKYGSRSPVSGKRMWHEPELLAAYPEGSPITVYYDPKEPASSVITRSLGLVTYLMLALGLSLALLGGVQFVNLAWIWASGAPR